MSVHARETTRRPSIRRFAINVTVGAHGGDKSHAQGALTVERSASRRHRPSSIMYGKNSHVKARAAGVRSQSFMHRRLSLILHHAVVRRPHIVLSSESQRSTSYCRQVRTLKSATSDSKFWDYLTINASKNTAFYASAYVWMIHKQELEMRSYLFAFIVSFHVSLQSGVSSDIWNISGQDFFNYQL